MSLLTVAGLTVRYGSVQAVTDVGLVAEPTRPVAVLGRNGAGKSSLLGAIAGLVRTASGTVTLDGADLTGQPADRRARAGLVLVPEGRRLFPRLTVEENLRLGGFSRSAEAVPGALSGVVELFPVLGRRLDSPAGTLSGGEQQMLAVGRALMADPAVLLLDEPSHGLAPHAADQLYGRLAELTVRGIAIVLVEQHVSRALEFATDALVLDDGVVVAQAEAKQLAADPQIARAYLGRGGASPTPDTETPPSTPG